MSHLDSYVWNWSSSELSDDVAFFLAAWLTYLKGHCLGGWMDQDLNYELTGTHQAKSGTRQVKSSTWNLFRGGKFKNPSTFWLFRFFWRLLVSTVLRVCWGRKKLSRGRDGPPCLYYPFIVDSMMHLQDNFLSTNYYSSIASLKLFQLGHHAFAIGSCLYYI